MADEKILSVNLPNFITIGLMWLGWLALIIVIMVIAGRVTGAGGSS